MGWLKLYRPLLLHPRFQNGDWLKLWLCILLSATHQTRAVIFGGKPIQLQPGQFITSRRSLSEKTGVEQSKVERLLSVLQTEQQIEQQSCNASRLVTVVNWSRYQHGEQPFEQRVNNHRTAGEQRVNTNKKEEKEVELLSIGEGKNGTVQSSKSPKVKGNTLPDPPPALGAQPDFPSAWAEFQAHRRELKKPLTPTAAKRVLATLAERPAEAVAGLNFTVSKGWQGFEWDWFDNAHVRRPSAPRPGTPTRPAARPPEQRTYDADPSILGQPNPA